MAIWSANLSGYRIPFIEEQLLASLQYVKGNFDQTDAKNRTISVYTTRRAAWQATSVKGLAPFPRKALHLRFQGTNMSKLLHNRCMCTTVLEIILFNFSGICEDWLTFSNLFLRVNLLPF